MKKFAATLALLLAGCGTPIALHAHSDSTPRGIETPSKATLRRALHDAAWCGGIVTIEYSAAYDGWQVYVRDCDQ